MDTSSPLRSLGAAVLLPAFLLGSIFCTCLGQAALASTTSPAHACCSGDERPEQTPAHDHHSDCQHCNDVQSFETASVKAPQPTIATTPWIPHPLVLVRLSVEPGFPPGHHPLSIESPPDRHSILREKCVLLI